MRRPIDLSQYKEIIISRFQDDVSAESIADYLLSTFRVKVTEKTIRRRLLEWGVSRRTYLEDTPELRARIAGLYYNFCFSDKEILDALKQEGYPVTSWNLASLRRKMGLKRKVDLLSRDEADKALLEIVQKELDKGEIEGLGRGHLYTYFRMHGYNITRDRLFAAIRKLDTAGVSRRLYDLQRHRGAYIVPGPNYLWSVDGYRKLQFWGIEVYAAIDAYSRYIIWIYVGVSNHTAVSIARQYLQVAKTQNLLPRVIRADRGVETPLMAAAHYQLMQKAQPGIALNECFRYGTSTANQRIEAWWGQLTKSSIYRWREYFQSLNAAGDYDRTLYSDRIAILAIYIPIIRHSIHEFARLWNVHSIRRQRNRPYSISGKPVKLYFFPSDDVRDYGTEPDAEILDDLTTKITEYDVDQYLPKDTLNWCTEQLKQLGCKDGIIKGSAIFSDGSRAHAEIYLQLGDRIRAHMASEELPVLELLPTPVDNWFSGSHTENGINSDEMDLHNEGPDDS
ncbi:hypothetical protein BDV33DRAFT_211000 [Aspergillus novoparasiticus]|uniref:Integrase core domain-containing protein n=1 Tax=Aspergillus novoparasiticus TaxID=986946 RepID=A0A5N6E5W4_9EURO|nr:hypothetical protein BDV33DRAFT_211000 [Aspergillus novoparasiticus]